MWCRIFLFSYLYLFKNFLTYFFTEAKQEALIKHTRPEPEQDDSEYEDDEDEDVDISDVLGDIDDLLNEAEQAMDAEKTPEKMIPQKTETPAPQQKHIHVGISDISTHSHFSMNNTFKNFCCHFVVVTELKAFQVACKVWTKTRSLKLVAFFKIDRIYPGLLHSLVGLF